MTTCGTLKPGNYAAAGYLPRCKLEPGHTEPHQDGEYGYWSDPKIVPVVAKADYDELHAEVERLQRENGALARMYAVCEETLRERTEQLTVTHQALRDALKEQRRLTTADRQWADHVSGLVTERDRLSKLLEAERRVARTIGEAHKKDAAEVERLRTEMASDESIDRAVWKARCERAEAEVVRLQADNVRLAECWTAEQEAHA